MKKRNKKKKGLFNLKDNKGLILLISIQRQATYRYILEQSLALGKTEIEIIKELSAIEIKKFYDAYRKWKERLKHKRKNKLNKIGICNRR